jgi:predicted HAD superfamily Cof-like phosphohydrolase
MTTNFERVGEFMQMLGLPIGPPAALPTDDLFHFRLELIQEETLELVRAYRKSDLVEFADAIGDLLYVVYGLGHASGLPMDEVFAEIHRANMDKKRSDGTGKRFSKVDAEKPDGWQPPDLKKVIYGPWELSYEEGREQIVHHAKHSADPTE